MAKLTFYYGTMSSGKTIDLIQTAYKYNSKGMKAIILKPSKDTKGNQKIVSRIGLEKEVDILLGENQSIFEYSSLLKNITCLLVDEAQFLNEIQVLELAVLTRELNIPVICYGLKSDFQGQMFPGSKALFVFADQYEKLRAVCATKGCINNANFNARKINGQYVYEGPQVLIGADDEYDPLCSECFFEKVLKPNHIHYQKILQKTNKFKGD